MVKEVKIIPLHKFSILFLSIISLAFCSCNQKAAKLNVSSEQNSDKQTEIDDTIQPIVETARFEDLSGTYELKEGHTEISDPILSKDFKGAIIIEKLSDTDFGFYEVNKVKKLRPIGHFGIIRRVNKNYHLLGICHAPLDYIAKDTFTRGIYLSNPIIIKKERDFLGIIRYGSNFRSRQLYRKKEPDTEFYISLIKTLKATKLDYEDYLKVYRKALNHDKNKMITTFIFEDNEWKTKHIHNEIDTNFTTTYSYQSPNDSIQVLKKDSVFMAGF